MSENEHDNNNTENGSDVIKKELVKQHIQLWKPPYFGVRRAADAVFKLATDVFPHEPQALSYLQEFQHRSLEKLRQKGKLLEDLEIKIRGAGVGKHDESGGGSREETKVEEFPETWAASVTRSKGTLHLHQPNPDLTIAQLVQDLQTHVLAQQQGEEATKIQGIRCVHKGKTLLPTTCLHDLVGKGSNTTSMRSKAVLLCLVQTGMTSSPTQ